MDLGKRSEKAELLAVVLVGFLLKLFAGRSSLTQDGIMLPGFDEYYHMRRILFTVDHFPGTLWFDSYLNYPHGFNITWPPLFDLVTATLSVVLGQHSRAGIEMVSALVPMLIGSIAIVVVYYLVKELFGSRIALLAAFMTALAPYYLLYTMFAALDHHCLEVLLQLTSLLFIVMALTRSEKRIIFAVLAGLTMAALAYTWQGTDVYLGIFLVYAVVKMSLDQKSGSDSKDTATTLLAAYGVALILVLPFWSEPWMSPSFLGLAAMVVAISVMFAFSRLLAARKLPWTIFPLSLLAVVIVFALISPLTGGLFGVSGLIHSGLSYIWGGEMIGKISEAEPLIYDAETFRQVLFSGLGLNLLLSLAAFASIAAIIRRSDSARKP
ncbi:MAG: glycosyltransferase family 39 protein, partial [Methanothrix sp.]|nr:glycosyltransferase family 39 protein [Methanothrix sp.]